MQNLNKIHLSSNSIILANIKLISCRIEEFLKTFLKEKKRKNLLILKSNVYLYYKLIQYGSLCFDL